MEGRDMWNRAGLKSNAKENLRRFYWPAFLVCIIAGIFNGGGGSGVSGVNSWNNGNHGGGASVADFSYSDFSPIFNPVIIGVALIVFIVIFAVAFALTFFVGNPLIVGKNRFFMCNRDEKTGVGAIGYAFSGGSYLNVVKTMFFMQLFNLFWYFLFIIPGIIKSYEYAMIPYILSENPEIDRKRAFELSKEMMMGQKWNYFVLQISFIGWYLLGLLACCIGVLFVNPYYEATLSEFYGWARENMIATGFSNTYELKGFGEGTGI
jgi:uncharacterized membrane protein